MTAAARHLQLLNPETGEITEAACPNCAGLQHTIDELTKKHHGLLSQLGKLKADKTAEAKAHKWWGIAIALFLDWRIATNHIGSHWTGDRFWLCQPYLESDGYPVCRYAVWGLAAHPNTKQITPDYQEVYDSWELCFKNRATFERYANRGKAIFGDDLPLVDIENLLLVHRRRAGVKRV